ncbi:MAG: hypothetical protein KAU07_02620 [Candidatus Andersenbacteria bacterium]|nr:hypothetical protein [Candidatus Andersenbacteria bacterium]
MEEIFMHNKIISLEFELNFDAVKMMLKRLGVNFDNQEEVDQAITKFLGEMLINQYRLAKEDGFTISVKDKTT